MENNGLSLWFRNLLEGNHSLVCKNHKVTTLLEYFSVMHMHVQGIVC